MPKYYNGCPSVVELVIFICFLLIRFFSPKFPNELFLKNYCRKRSGRRKIMVI